MTSPHVKLAMTTIDSYVRTGSMPALPSDTPEELLAIQAGVFVCLKNEGQLRGCIGTIEPMLDNLALEIMENSVSAATRDPRFMPVEERELDSIVCSVDVLNPAEEIYDIRELEPKRYGVIVECGMKRGLLLPDLDGVDTAEQQIDIARRKAYITKSEQIKLYRFEVLRYE